MKKRYTLVAAVLLLAVSCLYPLESFGGAPYGPKARRFGVGIIAGEPTGLSVKGYLTHSLALDGIFSWSFVDDAFTFIGDATYDFFDIPISSRVVTLPFYAGAGAKLAVHSKRKDEYKTVVGVRVPIGVGVQWNNVPVEVFFEVGPGIEVAPETEFDISGGVGVRYYFF